MRFQDIDGFEYCLGAVSILHLMLDYGKGEDLMKHYGNWEITEDLNWEIYMSALDQITDIVSGRYIEAYDCDEYFFSSDDMTEYYRRCKEFGRRHGIRWDENPFVKKAWDEVCETMDLNDHGYDWRLVTGTRHKNASSLHFYRYPDFFQTVEMVEAILIIFDFYSRALIELRKELEHPVGEELIAA